MKEELAALNAKVANGDTSGNGWLYDLHDLMSRQAYLVALHSENLLLGRKRGEPDASNAEVRWGESTRLWTEMHDLQKHIHRLLSTADR